MLSFKINRLDISQSYFFGEVTFRSDVFKANIQSQKRGKVLKLPFDIDAKKRSMVVRLTGSEDRYVEDYTPYMGRSEWLEIDSDAITYFLADNQDELDTIEIMDR